MNRHYVPLVAVICLCPIASGQFTVTTGTTARYQGLPLRQGSQTVIDPPAVLGDVAVSQSLSDPGVDTFSFARSEARFGYDVLGGYSRNFARASGFAPVAGPPNQIFATSDSTASVAYRVTSPTTPVGTAIQIRAFLFFEGELGVANYFGTTGANQLEATFSSSFTVDGVALFDATASLEQRGPMSLANPTFTTTGPWGGSWAGSVEQVAGLGSYNAMTLSHLDTVNFQTVMAGDFDVVFRQGATAKVPAPWEAFAQADFSNTGRFSFQAFDASTGVRILDAQFGIVPGPGVLAAFGAAAGLMAGGRRRR